ncbi:hypothetical protein [Lacrimispora sp.]|uniref:hypothetical protein n=1 Tax=Lacrimispora sp. TaxID=2719234 RepID=UPI00286361A6|nr:hypothetical protein [Lacrimispora sp.]MDR7810494.1 hypothetical protein [Lacrimispora sp.]
MRHFRYLFLFCLVTILMVGCNNKEIRLTDYTWYIVDDSVILMLCNTSEQKSYKDLMVQLKGNVNSINETIQVLEVMPQDGNVKNALGVAYLQLWRFQEANEKFQEALVLSSSAEERVCILSNLAEVMVYQENKGAATKYLEEALELEINDPLKKLILQSNLTSIELYGKENKAKEISNIKKLIKEEKKILGSNQFIGIFNYKLLARACYYEDKMKRCKYYMNKALELNQNIYQDFFIEAHLYKDLAFLYYNSANGLNVALDYINANIDLLEQWQVQDSYDLLTSYVSRGNIYMNLGWSNRDLAIKDYEHVLELCQPYSDLATMSYYNLADTYVNVDRIIESYARAYYIWSLEGNENYNQEIEESLRKIYKKQVNNSGDYECWFQKQIIQAQDDLRKQWGE